MVVPIVTLVPAISKYKLGAYDLPDTVLGTGYMEYHTAWHSAVDQDVETYMKSVIYTAAKVKYRTLRTQARKNYCGA